MNVFLTNADDIKKAVKDGKQVFCDSTGYEVIRCNNDEYLINFINSDYYIGLTWKDGKTLNGEKFWYSIPFPETIQNPVY